MKKKNLSCASALRCFYVYYDVQKQGESEELKCLPDGN